MSKPINTQHRALDALLAHDKRIHYASAKNVLVCHDRAKGRTKEYQACIQWGTEIYVDQPTPTSGCLIGYSKKGYADAVEQVLAEFDEVK